MKQSKNRITLGIQIISSESTSRELLKMIMETAIAIAGYFIKKNKK